MCKSGARLASPPPLRDRWIDWVLRTHRPILIVALLVTAIAGYLATKLQVDSDLRRLLPADHEVVVSLERIEETFGSTGSVNVVVRGKDRAARMAFSDALAKELEGHPLLRDVDYRLPSDFFVQHALYYLSDAEMKTLGTRIDAWLHYEVCSAAPENCVSEPDPDALAKLESFVESKREEAKERTGFDELYERKGIDANVILLRPNQPAAQLDFAKAVSTQMREVSEEVFTREGAPWSGAGLEYNLVGPYINKADEHAIVNRDIFRAGAFALIGVMVVLYLLFRSMRAVLVLLVPLACGVVWSLALTYLLIGDLTLMTSMISTVVMGAGIDAGIHFYLRARKERREHDSREAIRRAFRHLIVPLLVASSTTVGAFGVMATSDFPAFREFGIIAAMGVALCLVAMVTVLPSLAALVGIKDVSRPPLRTQGLVSRGLLAKPGTVLLVVSVLTVAATLGARMISFEYNGRALQSDHTRALTADDTRLISDIFERDIHAGILIRPTLEETRSTLALARERRTERSAAKDSVVAELFGAPDLLPPATTDLDERREKIVALLEEDSIRELEEVAGVAPSAPRAEGGDDGDDWAEDDWDEDEPEDDEPEPAGEPEPEGEPAPAPAPDGSATPAEAPTEQARDEPKPASSDGEERRKLTEEDAKTLLDMLRAKPFTIDELPPVLLNAVRTPSGEYGVFAYPDFDAADMRKGVDFMDETSAYLDDDAIFVGETTVYAAMFLMMQEEAPVVLGLAAILITVLVLWQVRSMRQALMTLLPLVLALWWLLGIMGTIDLRFTLFNLPILPAILGIGVDNGVYLTDRIRRTKGEAGGLQRSVQETGSAIMAAMATTAIGFAAFMVGDSAGVRGIGAVAVLGIILSALAATLVLPSLSGVAQARREREE